jgi:hypothetical protein
MGAAHDNILIYNPSSDSVARVSINTDSGVTDQELEIEPLTSRIIRVKERTETSIKLSGVGESNAPVIVKSDIPVVVEGAVYQASASAD